MSDLPAAVHINEEGPREGFQFEKGPIATARKIELIDSLSKTGLTGSRSRPLSRRKTFPAGPTPTTWCADLRLRPRRYTGLWLNDRGFQRALAPQLAHRSGWISLSRVGEIPAANQNRVAAGKFAAQRAIVAMYMAPALPVERAADGGIRLQFRGRHSRCAVVALVQQILDIGARARGHDQTLSLADTMAWATPLAIKRVVGAVRERYPELDSRCICTTRAAWGRQCLRRTGNGRDEL